MSCEKKRLAVDLDKHARIDKFFESSLKRSKVVRGKEMSATRTGRDYFAATRKREEARNAAAQKDAKYKMLVLELKLKHSARYIEELKKKVADLEQELKTKA